MSHSLAGITNADIRDSIGTYSDAEGILAIDGTNVENLQTTGAVRHFVNGVEMTDLATIAEWDLSGAVVLSAKTGEVLAGTYAHPAIAAVEDGGETQTLTYVMACRGDVPYIIEPTLNVAAADDPQDYSLICPKGYAPFGIVKVVQTPIIGTGVAAFQLGVDDLTGITGRVMTIYQVSHVGANVADLVIV